MSIKPPFVIIFGPQAVGKMTVGEKLAEATGHSLVHNHLTLDPLLSLFEFKDRAFHRLNKGFRLAIAKELGAARRGMIFTYCWGLDIPEERDDVEALMLAHGSKPEEAFYVELHAPLDVRLDRNETQNRLEKKPSKRDVNLSRSLILHWEFSGIHENTSTAFPFHLPERHAKIDNSERSASEVVSLLLERFPDLAKGKGS